MLARLDTMVRRFMSPGVVSLPATAPLQEACQAMARHGLHAIVVVADDGRPAGLVTSAGLVARRSRDLALRPVGLEIDEQITLITPSATAEAAAKILEQPGVTHLLVAASLDAVPEGMVTSLDVVKLLA